MDEDDERVRSRPGSVSQNACRKSTLPYCSTKQRTRGERKKPQRWCGQNKAAGCRACDLYPTPPRYVAGSHEASIGTRRTTVSTFGGGACGQHVLKRRCLARETRQRLHDGVAFLDGQCFVRVVISTVQT